MAYLSLSLLGRFQARLAGATVTEFESDKVRALLAYLAVEADRPHRRDFLAGLLWSEWSDRGGRANLRNALANLRTAIGDRTASPSFLLITRETIQFNLSSDHWLDVAAFRVRVEADPPVVGDLKEAVDLYRGGFLEGFFLKDCPAFDDWSLLTRERLERQAMSALHWLAEYHERRGEYGRACDYAWREVELEPWHEEAQRRLMRLLALTDRRSAALVQYETCCRLLDQELGVEPAEETTRLYERIRDGELIVSIPSAAPAPELPDFLCEEEKGDSERAVFVARERELAQLEGFLDLALAGKGRVAFVTGEAGSGKTALTRAFARQAQDGYADLIIASGKCNAYTGVGDPYLPFREILQLLTGAVEARWRAGAITREHAGRLWRALPLVVQALLDVGPDLIGTFVRGSTLVERVARASGAARTPSPGAEWLDRLDEVVGGKARASGAPGPQQRALFEQYTRVLQHLAREKPLVLVVDDLQWADAGSINLLFHLGRRLRGSRILVLGAFRPDEVALGRHGRRHPLEAVVNELRRDYGDITVDLADTEGRRFLEALLDSEPNRLGSGFRETLFRQTHGHPLFTIELLRGLQERGDLVRDREGRWVKGPALEWETLPARVEAVIAERIGRLEKRLRQMLRVASVEGEICTAEVMACVQGLEEREAVILLSGELDRRHRLVRAETTLRVRGQRLSRYRFRHILFQTYLYSSLDEVERMHLHEEVGRALERLCGEEAREMAVELAHHFREAGIPEKAVYYLHEAGAEAVRVSANEAAIEHYSAALNLVGDLSRVPERLEQELTLQLALTAPLEAARGFTAPETHRAYARAYELSQRIGETEQLVPALLSLGVFHHARAEHRRARDLNEQALDAARRAENPLQVTIARWLLGLSLMETGELRRAREHFEHVIAFYDPQRHAALVATLAQDLGVSALKWACWTLWLLGYPDQALERSREALALARRLDHLYTLGFALFVAAYFHQMRREDEAAQQLMEELLQLSRKEGFPLFVVGGRILEGWTLALAGQADVGARQLQMGLESCREMGTEIHRSHWLGLLAEAQAGAGETDVGLRTLAQALAFVERTGERYYEAELHRLQGELLLVEGDEEGAEASFLEATATASRQHARSWELRATVSLCRLWRDQGRTEEARQRLAKIYEWFSEGFETPDLVDARMLLTELSG